jgi:deazaflavin-dependent oxidoreductase (nitroreductase family)
MVTTFQKYVLNPVSKRYAGIVGPALLETTGRTSGKKRRTPVGAKLKGGSYWIVSEHGRHSGYVRNIEADRNVRIRHRRKWHSGKAHILRNEDPKRHAHGLNGLIVRLVGTDLLVIRIDPSK